MIAFNAVMPLMMYMLIGHWIKKKGWMAEQSFRDLNKVIFNFLLPLNLMMNIYHTEINHLFDAKVLAFGVISALTIFTLYAIVVPLIEKDPAKQGVMLQGGMRSNFVIFALPIATTLLDGRDLGMTTVLIAVLIPINNVLSIVALTIYKEGERINGWQVLKTISKNLMFIGTLVGIAIKLIGLEFPTFLVTTADRMTASITPLALMVMGGTFNFKAMGESKKQLLITIFMRLILAPVLGITAAIFCGIRGESLIPLMIFFSGPTAVTSYPMAEQMGGDSDLASQVVIFTTLLSILTLVIIISVVSYLGYL